MKPYAMYLLERFKAGETAEELALREGIPIERIRYAWLQPRNSNGRVERTPRSLPEVAAEIATVHRPRWHPVSICGQAVATVRATLRPKPATPCPVLVPTIFRFAKLARAPVEVVSREGWDSARAMARGIPFGATETDHIEETSAFVNEPKL
jgi:hypothetical protein